jgi:GT2 family glycosyltransferase
MIEVVTATRLTKSEFWSRSALGISLRRLGDDSRLVARPIFENRRSLPEIYNAGISAANGNAILIFVHDDVWIDDYFVADRIIEGLRAHDVIGVAGNRRRVPGQPAWAFIDTQFTWDMAHLSGAIAHGTHPFGRISFFGPAPAQCELLDGVFLAASAAALKEKDVRFDPVFDFHLYDMDFCRTARQRGLRLGTWPICLTHQSAGKFGAPEWTAKYRAYLDKWER